MPGSLSTTACRDAGKNIAEVFAVSLSTIMGWRRKHAKFGAAWDNGGTIADGELAHALFKRGKGYTHISEEVTYDVKRGGWVRLRRQTLSAGCEGNSAHVD